MIYKPEIYLTPNTFFIDGGCLGNNYSPRLDRLMAICVADFKGNEVYYKTKNNGTNNLAEFMALKECIMAALVKGFKQIYIYTDSRNNLSWFNYVKPENSADVHILKTAIDSMRRDIQVTLEWIPREENLAGHILARKLKRRYN